MATEHSITDRLPYLTADLPGIGGAIKESNEDFCVEELPLYEPSGQGTHTYFTIEKQGLTTLAAIKIIAGALGKRTMDIGYAGLKDAHGVTRQRLSVEHIDPQRVAELSVGRIKVLSVSQHINKLKLGHLRGNRFEIIVRNVNGHALPHAQAVLDVLAQRGIPNYFGPQRFGSRGDNADIGRAVLLEDFDTAIGLILGRPGPLDHGEVLDARTLYDRGDFEAASRAWPRSMRMQARVCQTMLRSGGDTRKAWRTVDQTLRNLYLSAFQSKLFNEVAARRIKSIDRLFEGDMAWKHANGACFRVDDAALEQPRCEALEVSPTGPLFGRRMTPAAGEPGRMEREVFEGCGLGEMEAVLASLRQLDGARRPLRVPLTDAAVTADADSNDHSGKSFLRLTFSLPAGAYATTVLREICKNDSAS